MRQKREINVGIIGCGNMGRAIAEGLKEDYRICVFDKDRSKTRGLSGIAVADNIIDLLRQTQALILAVKPQDFGLLLKEIKDYAKGKLVISIAAGINTAGIENVLENARVIRAMPNIGMRIRESVTCLSKGSSAGGGDLELAGELFSCLGKTREIKEALMNAATAIVGSGPAYIYDDLESGAAGPLSIPEQEKQGYIRRLAEAAVSVGFSPEEAMFLAAQTTETSINLIKRAKLAPEELKRQIASKGGTTQAALEVLHKGGSWKEAAQAAVKRAEELSK